MPIDEKTKELVRVARIVTQAYRNSTCFPADIVSLREAIVAVEHEQVGKMLLDLKAAMENGEMTELYKARRIESRDAFFVAIDAWFDLHKGDDDE